VFKLKSPVVGVVVDVVDVERVVGVVEVVDVDDVTGIVEVIDVVEAVEVVKVLGVVDDVVDVVVTPGMLRRPILFAFAAAVALLSVNHMLPAESILIEVGVGSS
jgi:hypothetical protein